jgi:N-acyl-D-amino-acid deacylase
VKTFLLFLVLLACHPAVAQYDLILRNGLIIDGSGRIPFPGDVAVQADTIARIGYLSGFRGKEEIDLHGMAVSPGFINMLSWADRSLLLDGRSMSDIKQGVTLEIFGEGFSPGPKKKFTRNSPWKSLGEYFTYLQSRGVSPNFASFVGATTIRTLIIGYTKRAPNEWELDLMKQETARAMEEGALGLASSLIYAPASFTTTRELIELAQVAGEKGGIYITHLRSEGDSILYALEEALRIGREADLPVEIYHMKINKRSNWNKIDTLLRLIDNASKTEVRVTANMYPYTFSATGLSERIPDWVKEGGFSKMLPRLRNAEVRKKVLKDMREGITIRNSDPADVELVNFRTAKLRKLYFGKRLIEVARLRKTDADEAVLDLLLADRSDIAALYHLISEDNLRRMLALPYVSLGSDGASVPEGRFELSPAHPRVFGTFARFLGKYVREEGLVPLHEAVRRMTSLPAGNLSLQKRGRLKSGYYADVVVFDPYRISDRSTVKDPARYATGVVHVWVNGVQVLKAGEHTGALPGRMVPGPAYVKGSK